MTLNFSTIERRSYLCFAHGLIACLCTLRLHLNHEPRLYSFSGPRGLTANCEYSRIKSTYFTKRYMHLDCKTAKCSSICQPSCIIHCQVMKALSKEVTLSPYGCMTQLIGFYRCRVGWNGVWVWFTWTHDYFLIDGAESWWDGCIFGHEVKFFGNKFLAYHVTPSLSSTSCSCFPVIWLKKWIIHVLLWVATTLQPCPLPWCFDTGAYFQINFILWSW